MKKKIINSLIIFSCLCHSTLSASTWQDQELDRQQQNETEVLEGKTTEIPFQQIGVIETPIKHVPKDSEMQNWLYAAGSIVSAAVGFLIVSWGQGAAPTNK